MMDGATMDVVENADELRCAKLLIMIGQIEYAHESVDRLSSGGATYIYRSTEPFDAPFVPQDPAGGDGGDPAPEIRGFEGDRCSPPPMPEWTPPESSVEAAPEEFIFEFIPDSGSQDQDDDGLPDDSESPMTIDAALEELAEEVLTFPVDPAGGDGSDPAPEIRGFTGDRCTPPPVPEYTPLHDQDLDGDTSQQRIFADIASEHDSRSLLLLVTPRIIILEGD